MNRSKMISGLMVVLAVLVSNVAIAADVCVSNASEFSSQSANLPQVVQKLPAMLVTDGFLVTAGLKIRTAGDKLKLEGYVWKPGEIIVDDAYISKACFDGKNFDVTLESGKSYSVKVKGDKSVSIQGVTFDKSSESKFASIVERIKAEQTKRTGVSSSGVQ